MKYIALVSFLFIIGIANAQDTLTIEKAISRYRIGTIRISPDEKRIAFVVTEPISGSTSPNSDVWIYDISSQQLGQFTWSPKSDNNPKWSPDGKTLAFLSGRNSETQVFLISTTGGEASQLTKSKTSVKDFEWSPDGKSIAYLASEPATEQEEKDMKAQDDETWVDFGEKPTRLWTIDIESKVSTQRSKQNWQIRELKWLPNGTSLALIASNLPKEEMVAPALGIFNVADGSFKKLESPTHPFWGGMKLSPDGKQLGYVGSRLDGPTTHDLFLLPLEGGPAKNLTGKNIDLPVTDYKFLKGGSLLLTIQKGFSFRFYESAGTEFKVIPPDQNIGASDISSNGIIAFTSFTSVRPEELWLAGPGQSPKKVTDFNKAFDGYKLVQPEFIKYKSFDGTMIEGSFYKPAASTVSGQGSSKTPLAVLVHGGPTGAWTDSYNFWIPLFVSRGFAVFCPNIRGSTGYGHKFIEMNRNDWGGGDFKDVMSGVDFLVAQRGIDPNRLGIAGWSYGGYMTMWAVTQTNRFKVAMAGAGLSDLASEYGTEDGADYDRWFFGTPYEKLDNFTKSSPITFVKNAKTPTLIIQGEKDPVDPIGQSQQFYRGLRHYRVTTELVVYPREPHGFSEEKHIVDYSRRMLEWFRKYLK